MVRLLFMHRVAFICNLMFILACIFRHSGWQMHQQWADGTIIILGFFLSPICNFITLGIQLLRRNNLQEEALPKNLSTFNLIIFVFQIVYFFLT